MSVKSIISAVSSVPSVVNVSLRMTLPSLIMMVSKKFVEMI